MDSEGASPPWGQSGFFDGLIRMPPLKDAAAPKLLGCAGPRTKAAGKAAFLMACPQGGAGWLGEKKPGARRGADRAGNVRNRSES